MRSKAPRPATTRIRKCKANCALAPRCGDGLPHPNEQCDDGKNDGIYGTCNANCTFAAYCGDGVPTAPELCDKGSANNKDAYGPNKCTDRCTPAPTCGDKAVDGKFGEVCDDGGQGACTADCKGFTPTVLCGNKTINAPEQCDDGTANASNPNGNGSAASTCDVHCRNKCGNGIKEDPETCDNGVNDGSYGGCTATCQIAGFCGDGTKNGPEQCDNGAQNVILGGPASYGPGKCTTGCTIAPYCGDGRVQNQYGEECDTSAACNSSCKDTGPK